MIVNSHDVMLRHILYRNEPVSHKEVKRKLKFSWLASEGHHCLCVGNMTVSLFQSILQGVDNGFMVWDISPDLDSCPG